VHNFPHTLPSCIISLLDKVPNQFHYLGITILKKTLSTFSSISSCSFSSSCYIIPTSINFFFFSCFLLLLSRYFIGFLPTIPPALQQEFIHQSCIQILFSFMRALTVVVRTWWNKTEPSFKTCCEQQ